jgi:type IV pilus assembly protein PilX
MRRHKIKTAQGSVLIVSLVILLVLTLLGLSGMGNTVMQERMAGNAQESLSAFQAAEAGLREGEWDVFNNIFPNDPFLADCTAGRCQPAAPSDTYEVWEEGASKGIDWKDYIKAIEFGSQRTPPVDLPGVSQNPSYLIERLQVIDQGGSLVAGFSAQQSGEWYRITARGFGRNGQSQATVQSVFRK